MLYPYPIRLEFDVTKGALILEGEVENIVAQKRRVRNRFAREMGRGHFRRLTVTLSERRGDGAIRVSLIQELLQEPALIPCCIRAEHKGTMETLCESHETPDGTSEAFAEQGVEG